MAVAGIALSACNGGSNKSGESKDAKKDSLSAKSFACPMHPEVTGKKGDKCSKCGMELMEVKSTSETTAPVSKDANQTVSAAAIVNVYLQLKNAFVKDDSREAARAGTELENAFQAFDKTVLTAAQKNIFEELEDDAVEHAEHIAKNGGKIEHQREHFAMLGQDIYDLVKTFGGGQILYKDFCPMFNEGKGAFWISETKGIKNPFYGKTMPTCGTVKEEIK